MLLIMSPRIEHPTLQTISEVHEVRARRLGSENVARLQHIQHMSAQAADPGAFPVLGESDAKVLLASHNRLLWYNYISGETQILHEGKVRHSCAFAINGTFEPAGACRALFLQNQLIMHVQQETWPPDMSCRREYITEHFQEAHWMRRGGPRPYGWCRGPTTGTRPRLRSSCSRSTYRQVNSVPQVLQFM